MAKNELLPFADGEDANVLSTNQWEALTDILENGFQSGIAKSEQVNRVLAQGAVASYVLGQLIVDQLSKDATLDKDTLYQNLILALQENAKDVCLPLTGGDLTGNLTILNKNIVRSVSNQNADPNGNVNVRTVIDTWSSGASWYRVWSDGWIEQGGTIYITKDKGSATLNMPFTSTNYFLQICNTSDKSASQYQFAICFTSKTTTAFSVERYNDLTSSDAWYACGY